MKDSLKTLVDAEVKNHFEQTGIRKIDGGDIAQLLNDQRDTLPGDITDADIAELDDAEFEYTPADATA